jgi:hypothetical protein
MVLCAAACGALDALAWMHERLSLDALDLLYNPMVGPRGEDASHDSMRVLCNVAAANGHLAIIRWARERNHPWFESTCHVAAKHDHVSVLAWLRANGCPWNEAACRDIAAMHACHNVVKWINRNRDDNGNSSRDRRPFDTDRSSDQRCFFLEEEEQEEQEEEEQEEEEEEYWFFLEKEE